MLRKVLTFAFLLAGFGIQAQVPLWMGFSQEWGYNHRIKRMGDFVEEVKDESGNKSWRHVHTAASGSGADRGEYLSRLARIEGDSIFFHSGFVELDIKGYEKDELNLVQRLELPDLPGEQHVILLNGFDLYTPGASKADKFELFEVKADSLGQEDGKWVGYLSTTLRMACSSPECQAFKNEYEYRLRIQYVVISGGSGFSHKKQNFNTFQSWDTKEVLDFTAIPCEFPLKKAAAVAVPAFQSIRLELNKEQHMLDWSSFLAPPDRVRSTVSELTLGFRSWDEDMREAYRQNYRHGKLRIPSKWAVQKKKGWSAMGASVVMLYFEKAKVGYYEVEGSFSWETSHKDQQPADGSLAETRKDLW